mmetsp:Transcript_22582/g.19588  ORF Transcript_22582/g.19588 Transcript_22582/m.19588 type:complete len:116 (-) Transcript_22582:1561-1908(-)
MTEEKIYKNLGIGGFKKDEDVQKEKEYERMMEERIREKKKNKKKKKKKAKLDLSKKKVPKEIHDLISEKPFIVNTKIQYHDRPFEKGNGIDVYIDGCRFLPDNTTVTKIEIAVLS